MGVGGLRLPGKGVCRWALRGMSSRGRWVACSRRCLCWRGLPFFSRGDRVSVGGAMTEEKVEEGCRESESSGRVLVGEVLPPEKEATRSITEVIGAVLLCKEADRQLGLDCVLIITAVIGKAKNGDLPSIKLLLELSEKAGRAEEISKEEVETLGAMLMREFHAFRDVDNVVG